MPDAPVAPARRPRGRPGHDRDTVLRRAVELFIRQGYDGTSIGDLGKELGVTKSAIYHHFDSKESILAAVLDEALEELSGVVDAAGAEAGGSAYERLRSTVEASVRILVAHLPAVTVLLRVRGNSDLELRALERRRHIDEQLAQLVREAAAEGTLRDDIDPDLISRLVFGLVNSLTEWFRPGGPIDGDALAGTVADAVFEGLRTED